MTNIQAEKIDLIKIIANTDDGALLHRLRAVVDESDSNLKLARLAAIPAEQIDLEQLKKEQNYATENVAQLHSQWFTDDDYFDLLQMLD